MDTEKLITCESGIHKSVNDNFLVYVESKTKIRNVKIICREETLTQHKLLEMDCKFNVIHEVKQLRKLVLEKRRYIKQNTGRLKGDSQINDKL